MDDVKYLLDKLYKKCNFNERILHDPIEFPHRYEGPEDIEIAGFIASFFAYGKVNLFKPIIEKILSLMSGSPYDFLLNFRVKKEGQLFSGLKYRFNESRDIIYLLYITGKLIRRPKNRHRP